MKVQFSEKNRDLILEKIQTAMAGRKLDDLVSFQMGQGFLDVIISKLGTSTLRFKETEHAGGLSYILESEKIAFAHRAFRDDVKDKLIKVIEKAGGSVQV